MMIGDEDFSMEDLEIIQKRISKLVYQNADMEFMHTMHFSRLVAALTKLRDEQMTGSKRSIDIKSPAAQDAVNELCDYLQITNKYSLLHYYPMDHAIFRELDLERVYYAVLEAMKKGEEH